MVTGHDCFTTLGNSVEDLRSSPNLWPMGDRLAECAPPYNAPYFVLRSRYPSIIVGVTSAQKVQGWRACKVSCFLQRLGEALRSPPSPIFSTFFPIIPPSSEPLSLPLNCGTVPPTTHYHSTTRATRVIPILIRQHDIQHRCLRQFAPAKWSRREEEGRRQCQQHWTSTHSVQAEQIHLHRLVRNAWSRPFAPAATT